MTPVQTIILKILNDRGWGRPTTQDFLATQTKLPPKQIEDALSRLHNDGLIRPEPDLTSFIISPAGMAHLQQFDKDLPLQR